MRSMVSALLAMACVSLFTGCKKAEPKFQTAVPAGWQVAQEQDQDGTQVKILANADGDQIQVACLPNQDGVIASLLVQTLSLVEQIGGEMTEFVPAEDESGFRVAFTAERKDGVKFIGREVVRVSSGKDKVVVALGFWPADKDAALAPDFEKVAASVDFK